MSCIVQNHIYYGKNQNEIILTHTKPLALQNNICILLINHSNNKKIEVKNILLSYRLSNYEISTIRSNTKYIDDLIEFTKLLGYSNIYEWKYHQLRRIM